VTGMALVTTDAIVLRSYNLAEADRIVICLTRSSGLVRGVARGARRMNSRFGAALEPYTLTKLTYFEKENRELVTISQVDILQSQFNVAAVPETGEVLAYISEMVTDFAPPHEANEKLFRMVVACVEALQKTPRSTTAVLRYFEVWLLRLAGLFPDIQKCSQCGTEIEITARRYLDFEGGIRCQTCSRGSGSTLSAETHGLVLAIQRHSPVEFTTLFASLPRVANEQLAELTHRLIVRALERRPRSLVMSPSA
jgi:DNA repair protein RecO (recombination protein O)